MDSWRPLRRPEVNHRWTICESVVLTRSIRGGPLVDAWWTLGGPLVDPWWTLGGPFFISFDVGEWVDWLVVDGLRDVIDS